VTRAVVDAGTPPSKVHFPLLSTRSLTVSGFTAVSGPDELFLCDIVKVFVWQWTVMSQMVHVRG